jgi:tetratricopeptide (TPR) repeat protein
MPGTGFRSIWFAVLSLAILYWSLRAQETVSAPVQTLLKEGDSAFAQGDCGAALLSFEKAQQMAQQLPADSTVRYEILKRLASTSAASGQFNNAESYIGQAVKWRESTIGPKDSKLVDDLLLLINLKMRTKEFDQALAIAKRVQAMHVAAYTPESIPVADDFLRIGQIYLAEEKPREAARALQTAAGLRTKLAGALDPGLLPVLDKLIEAFQKLAGDAGTGNEPLYRQALMIRETLYGKESSELISTLEGLADTYAAGGEYDAAEAAYLRLLALWEKVVGKDHPMVAVTLDKLVLFYAKQGKSDAARAALKRSVAIRARFLAVGLGHEAVDEIARGHSEEARALYNRALAALGPPDPANEELIGQIREAIGKLQSSPPK